jgi:ABC-type Fe3+-hydroxamate transport system substrate-binding protein
MASRIVIDQMGRRVEVSENPLRIVSLVPSQTELLAYLGLENNVVGITKFCIHPREWYHTKRRIGGTKNLKIQEIIELKPDLIIGNKEENTKLDIESLADRFPVWMSDVNSVDDALIMIKEIGELTNTVQKATKLSQEINQNFQSLSRIGNNRKVLYCIWDDPTMTAGRETYIHSILSKIGFVNVIEQSRYPAITADIDLQPEVVLLSSEPFPFTDNHVKKYQNIFPNADVQLVDGEMFSWYGSRMLEATEYFQKLSTK